MMRWNLSEWAVTHRPMVLFLLIITLVGGALSFQRLGRLEDPSFRVPAMTIVVAWPGARADEMQDKVLDRMERELQEIEGVDRVSSFARQGFGGLTLWMEGGTPKKDLDAAWYLARRKIADIRHELPEDLRGPFFNDEFGDVYAVLYALRAPELGWAELQLLAENLKRSLQSVPGVTKVDVLGRQAERVFVEFSTERLAASGLTPQALLDAIARHNALAPSGAVDGSADRTLVRLGGAPRDARDVGMLPIEAGGRLLRLWDVATVRSGVEEPPAFTMRHDGEPALAIGIVMRSGGDILALGKTLDARQAALQSQLPAGVRLEKYADQPSIVEEAVWEFEKAFLEALAIVLAVSFLALGWRTGIVIAASVPLVLGMVAVVMHAAGWTLDRISLGALIIALGLLVDDAIIAVEMMMVKIEEGWDRMRAATFAYTSTALPMLTGTMVTVAGFMPVGLAKSIAGEYAGGIFWVVGVALVASWLVAVLFTPYLGMLMLPKVVGAHRHDPYGKPLYRALRAVVDRCLAHRVAVLASTAALFVAAIVGMTLVQQQFFPTASRPELLVELRLREGSSFEATERQVRRLEAFLKADPQARRFTAYTGAGSPRFYLSLEPELPNPAYAQIVVVTDGLAEREALRQRLMALFDVGEAFPDVRGRVQRLEFGPPVGFPVQVRIVGPDVAEVRRIAYRVRDVVRASPLVRNTHLDWNEQARTARVDIDQDKARLLGLASVDIANQVQAALLGVPVTLLRRGEELIEVTLRSVPADRRALERLDDMEIFARTGAVVPLSQIARITPAFEEPVLHRRDRETVLTVRSDLADGIQGPYATQQIWPSLQPVLQALPPGYRVERGGAIEESEKANVALFAVFPAMAATMAFFLMLQLQSFSRVAIVLLTAPLGLIGVVPALLAFGAPFGFVALLGVIALAGMIMRNTVILVDQIDRDIAQGSAPWPAIVGATVRRARPVVLTAAAAALAMIPLTRSVFWGPMAIAIMGGLLAATALTLLAVPALYGAWFRVARGPSAAAPAVDRSR